MAMIKVTELRIGNLLRRTGPDWTVMENKIMPITIEDLADIDFNEGKGFEPVLLDQEILQLCGFMNTRDSDYELDIDGDNKLIASPYIEGGYAVQLCCQNNFAGLKPRYLHQLQNFYYSFTGQEMKML